MSHLNDQKYPEIPLLFSQDITTNSLSVRAYMGKEVINATLNNDGSVLMGTMQYKDIQKAMEATRPLKESTSNPWQFWTWYSDERKAWTPLEHLRAKLDNNANFSKVKTSVTHPLRIDAINITQYSGRIGLTFCPGKRTEGLYGGIWERDLDTDIKAIKAWGGSTLISLMEEHEFESLGVAQLLVKLPNTSELDWLHLPIQDMQIPDKHFEAAWASIGPTIHQKLKEGRSIVIHCRGGLGRTGLLAARILVEAGLKPADAVATVRTARERSIETYSQEHYVLTKEWENTN